MKIVHTVEKPDGSVTFQGNVAGSELAFLLEYAVNGLLEQGALPFLTKKTVESVQMPETPTTHQ